MGLGRATRAVLLRGLALAAVLWLAAPAVAAAAAPAVAARPGLTADSQPAQTSPPNEPSPPEQSASVGRPQTNVRTGGSDPEPGRGKPGWVWWAAGASALALLVGGIRLWRRMVESAPE